MPEFVRNNRGIDDGQDLPRDYLEMIYSQIEAEEFRKMVILLYAGEQWRGLWFVERTSLSLSGWHLCSSNADLGSACLISPYTLYTRR